MKAQIRRIWAFVRVFWWVLLIVGAVGVVVILAIAKCRCKTGLKSSQSEANLVQTVTQNIQGAVTDVRVETAIIRTQSDDKRATLDDIRKEKDPVVRRERLAAHLRGGI